MTKWTMTRQPSIYTDNTYAFVADDEEARLSIPTDKYTPGSSCYVIATKLLYIADSQRAWHEV